MSFSQSTLFPQIRKQMASIGQGSKTSFVSSTPSFDITPPLHYYGHSGEARVHGSSAWNTQPTASSVESGLGGSVDSPVSEVGLPGLPPIIESDSVADSRSKRDKKSDTTTTSQPYTSYMENLPPLSVERLRREINSVKSSWGSMRLALTCADCGQELKNTEPKVSGRRTPSGGVTLGGSRTPLFLTTHLPLQRHCWMCARVACQRCLRPSSGPEVPEFANLREIPHVDTRLRICLSCESRLLRQSMRD